MARVNIETVNAKDPRKTLKLLEILQCNDIYATRLIPVHEGFVVLTGSEDELDKIFNNSTDKKLQEKNFFPQIPPELIANRSVFLFRVDSLIFENNEEDMKTEIEKKNEWVGNLTIVY